MIRLCIGRRGQGKTTLALYLARKLKRRIIFDPRGLVRETPGRVIVSSHTTQIQQAIGLVIDGDIPEVVITPTLHPQAAFDVTVRELHEWIRTNPRAEFAILIDEIRFVRELDTDHFEWLLRCSDPSRVHIILTCHRPADVPTDIRAIADSWLVFRVTQEHDRKVIDSRSPQVANIAKRLGPREFVAWDDASGEFTVYRKPETWYVPLGTNGSMVDANASLDLDRDSDLEISKLF